MAKIRSISEIASKWKDVTPRREAYYRAGVERPKEIWEDKTKAAADAWKDGVDTAGVGGFSGGVAKAGQAKWAANTKIKGVDQGRWKNGVTAFADEYSKGFAPYRDVIDATDPGPRYRKGDDRNYARVEAIGKALHSKKVAERG